MGGKGYAELTARPLSRYRSRDRIGEHAARSAMARRSRIGPAQAGGSRRGDAALQQRHQGNRDRPSREKASACSMRSEEHTSELQSLMRISYAVVCLKKKKKQQ